MTNRLFLRFAPIASAALLLAACSPSNQADLTETPAPDAAITTDAATSSAATEATTSAERTNADALTFENPVVRAKEASEDSSMTAIFGTLQNNTDQDITVTGFTTSLGNARYEVHQTVDGKMSPVEDGLVVPAGQSVELAPGGFHLMILDYPEEIAAGSTIDVTLKTNDGDIDVPGVEVRTMLPGGEDYDGNGDMSGMGDMGDMGEMAGHEGHNH